MADQILFARLYPQEYHRKFHEAKCRPDGRGFMTARPLSIRTGALASTDGSAIVKVGNTIVTCGVRLEIGIPDALAPQLGRLVVTMDMPNLCSRQLPRSQLIRQTETATIASSLQTAIMSAGLVNMASLCIQEGVSVVVVYADVVCLNDDGGVYGAAMLALQYALLDTQVPTYRSDDDGKVWLVEDAPTKSLLNGNPTQTGLIQVKGEEEDHGIEDGQQKGGVRRELGKNEEKGVEVICYPLIIGIMERSELNDKPNSDIDGSLEKKGIGQDQGTKPTKALDPLMLVDMSTSEEGICDGKVTLLCRQDGTIVNVNKQGKAKLNNQQLEAAMIVAESRAKRLAQAHLESINKVKENNKNNTLRNSIAIFVDEEDITI